MPGDDAGGDEPRSIEVDDAMDIALTGLSSPPSAAASPVSTASASSSSNRRDLLIGLHSRHISASAVEGGAAVSRARSLSREKRGSAHAFVSLPDSLPGSPSASPLTSSSPTAVAVVPAAAVHATAASAAAAGAATVTPKPAAVTKAAASTFTQSAGATSASGGGGGGGGSATAASVQGAAGWERQVDDSSGEAYWFNPVTGESRWTLPDECSDVVVDRQGRRWEKYVDEDSGLAYWYEPTTGASTWTSPAGEPPLQRTRSVVQQQQQQQQQQQASGDFTVYHNPMHR
jgi:hypothetical protein